MSEPNLLTGWAWLLFESLAQAGVTDVVISPGSRSTPFVLAAARNPLLRCHTVIDERSAAFFALGQARVTGRPSVLLCTSGTAAAHYLPAVIEASMSFTPLIVLTADRPVELQECAAPQTIDQLKLYGDYARRFFELGQPEEEEGALRALRRTAAQAVFYARSPTPGVVHLNARARKPLEPQPLESEAARALHDRIQALSAEPLSRPLAPRMMADREGMAALARACRSRPRGLIVCGPAPMSQVRAREDLLAVAALTGFPVLCEASSQFRFISEGVRDRRDGRYEPLLCDAFDALFRTAAFRTQLEPELIVQIGAAPTSSGWEQAMRAFHRTERFVVAGHGWQDPQSTADHLLFGEPADTLRQLREVLAREMPPRSPELEDWRARFAIANAAVWGTLSTELASADNLLSEGQVARSVVALTPPGAILAVGNSLPIRDVDAWCPARLTDVSVMSQRGANGIDGLVSGAAGAASMGERSVVLLVGDVSFLHDLTGLAIARQATTPLVIVVIQNGGGRIFEQLPIAATEGVDQAMLEHWVTSHSLEFGHAASLFGVPYARVEAQEALEEALTAALSTPGCTLIEAIVPPDGVTAQHLRIRSRIEAALTAVLTRSAVVSRGAEGEGDR